LYLVEIPEYVDTKPDDLLRLAQGPCFPEWFAHGIYLKIMQEDGRRVLLQENIIFLAAELFRVS
jgi:hypothetical protein